MVKENKLNGLVLVDKKKLAQMLDELKCDVESRKIRWYRCGICTLLYIETELTIKEDIGLICRSCERSMKELDDEQEEAATLIREEKKSKALP